GRSAAGKAQAEGVELLGPDGLLSQVTKAELERALAEEMTGHLGYEKHDPAGRGSGNSRNGPICLICAVAGLPELDLSAAQIYKADISPVQARANYRASEADGGDGLVRGCVDGLRCSAARRLQKTNYAQLR